MASGMLLGMVCTGVACAPSSETSGPPQGGSSLTEGTPSEDGSSVGVVTPFDAGTASVGTPVDAGGTHDPNPWDGGSSPRGDASPGEPDASVPAISSTVTPGDPGAHDVLLAINSTGDTRAISPYIYGTNEGDLTSEAKGLTLTRVGGNRLTAYNWENNASNAGSDYLYQNDAYLSDSSVAGQPMKEAVSKATSSGASILMTVPAAGWVAADKDGPCPAEPADESVIAERFHPIVPQKGSAFTYPPDTTDGKVYADEFVAWLESEFPTAQTDPARRVFYMIDNEPDLWSHTHSEIHPAPATYAETVEVSANFAKAIKAVAPEALVFGPVNYGWQGFVNLQSAPDASGRDFLDFYLESMKAAEATAGRRLIDVLDVHWYPEATGGGTRIIEDGAGDAEVRARLQAPRSLWDPSYVETSWITDCCSDGAIELLPRLKRKIAEHYPGTELSISEYNYGAADHISGGIAQADVLGVFGREGLFAATWWPLSASRRYVFAGFAMYRNYDGEGATFGDTSIDASTSDIEKSSVYASIASDDTTNVVVVAINKEASPLEAGITLRHSKLTSADVHVLTGDGPAPVKTGSLTAVASNAFHYTMPARSVTTLVFRP